MTRCTSHPVILLESQFDSRPVHLIPGVLQLVDESIVHPDILTLVVQNIKEPWQRVERLVNKLSFPDQCLLCQHSRAYIQSCSHNSFNRSKPWFTRVRDLPMPHSHKSLNLIDVNQLFGCTRLTIQARTPRSPIFPDIKKPPLVRRWFFYAYVGLGTMIPSLFEVVSIQTPVQSPLPACDRSRMRPSESPAVSAVE